MSRHTEPAGTASAEHLLIGVRLDLAPSARATLISSPMTIETMIMIRFIVVSPDQFLDGKSGSVHFRDPRAPGFGATGACPVMKPTGQAPQSRLSPNVPAAPDASPALRDLQG